MPRDERPTVLYVDDEPINIRVFQANFKNRFPILCAATGEEALAIIQSGEREIGVILSDQRMPGISGSQMLERARVMAPDAQRMLLTAYSDMQAVMDAVNRGQVSRYFVKPWVKEDLQAAIDDGLRIFSLQAKLRMVEGRMLRSERLATIGQVSAGIAHELMNPVSYMSQNVSMLRGELERLRAYIHPMLEQHPSEAVAQTLEDLPGLLNDVEIGADHIRKVALRVRSQARGDEGDQGEKECQLAEVAEFATKIARGEVQSVARVVLRGEPVRVMGSSVKLCQVLLNLIVNSAQAMDSVERNGLIEVTWQVEPSTVLLTVRDNGKGIPKELMERVFEPLFTTKPVGIGTGLGLSICKEIIEDLKGQLKLSSEEGAGTTIDMVLQRAAAMP